MRLTRIGQPEEIRIARVNKGHVAMISSVTVCEFPVRRPDEGSRDRDELSTFRERIGMNIEEAFWSQIDPLYHLKQASCIRYARGIEQHYRLVSNRARIQASVAN